KVCKEPMAVFDLFPTFAKLAGAPLPADRVIDGRDLGPLLAGKTLEKILHEVLYFYSFTHLQAARAGKWKLVLPRPARPEWCGWSAGKIDAVDAAQLFDLETDMGETTNVAGKHPDVVRQLMTLIDKGRAELGDYNRIGESQRFFDKGPRRSESKRWLP
ncbi:MAG: N-acetylgalactosamine-6-sulfatase, partial [Gemmataceae bacterium]